MAGTTPIPSYNSLSTKNHNGGEWVSGTQGISQTYDTWYNKGNYNLLTPAEKNKLNNYWVKNNPANAAINNVKNASDIADVVKGALANQMR